MQNWVLRTAALAVGIIGFGYLLVPARVLGIYGVELHSVTETAIVRAAYGGLFVAFALLFALGSQRDALARPALIALATFMGGFGLGRLASLRSW
jgi:drug/metabolite transporter superfamily protein YnfA